MEKLTIHILLVARDEELFLRVQQMLARSTSRFDLDVIEAIEAAVLDARRYHVIFFDLNLGEGRARTLLQVARAQNIPTPIILLGNAAGPSSEQEFLNEGAADYLAKSELSAPLLERSIRCALRGDYIVIARDVTERKRLDEALRQSEERYRLFVENANERVQQASNAQKRFVADASHDIRTPLTVIRAELELLLQRQEIDARTRAALERSFAEALRLDRLINDLILQAAFDAEDRSAMKRADAGSLLLEAIAEVGESAKSKEISWNVSIADGIEITCDEPSLVRALANVCDNAARFSHERGTVDVVLKNEDEEAVIAISDRGVGIPAGDLPMIFDRFFRGDVARSTPGSGLGLSIAKSVIEGHGGSITIESQPGIGTTATIRLPLANRLLKNLLQAEPPPAPLLRKEREL
jgi:signal transduction histidine kinase